MSVDERIPSSQQVGQILGSSKLALALENDKYKHLLDHAPVAVAVSRGSGGKQHVVYINKAFENLMSMASANVEGQSWTCLDGFLSEDSPAQTLGEAIRDGEDFIGVFRPSGPVDRLVIVQAYASVIESDDGIENFRIAALVDVGGRERAQIEQFETQIRDRDMLMRELQHRVKNNLQLITALIRLEARSAVEGETVALGRLASRIDALTVPPLHASRELVDHLMTFLKPAERLVIDLLYLQQRSIAEIQKMTGWSGALVKLRAFRARQKMKKQMSLITTRESQ